MTEMTEISGVGPSRAEDLHDAGYEDAESVANADPAELDDMFSTLSGEALVDAAQDAVSGDEQDAVDETDTDEDDESADTDDTAKVETFTFSPGFSAEQEYHLMASLVNEEVDARRRNNKDRLTATQDALESVRSGEPYEFTLQQLSIGYRAMNQLEAEYRGTRGLSTFVSNVRDIQQFFQDARSENWPDNE